MRSESNGCGDFRHVLREIKRQTETPETLVFAIEVSGLHADCRCFKVKQELRVIANADGETSGFIREGIALGLTLDENIHAKLGADGANISQSKLLGGCQGRGGPTSRTVRQILLRVECSQALLNIPHSV